MTVAAPAQQTAVLDQNAEIAAMSDVVRPEAVVSWRRFARQSAWWAVFMIGGVASACMLYAVATPAQSDSQAATTAAEAQTGYFADLSPGR